MGLEDSLKFVETYAKDYLHYILAFFKQLRHEAEDPPPTLDDGRLLIFSLMNAVIGAALQGLFVQHTNLDKIAFPQIVIIEVCYWLALCIVTHALLNSRRAPAHFADAITAILGVAPAAFVIGAYSAFVVYYLALLAPDPRWAAPLAAIVNAGFQLGLMARYLRPAVFEIRGSTAGRKWVAFLTVMLIVGVVHLIRIGLSAESLGPAKAGPEKASSVKVAAAAPRRGPAALILALMIGLAALGGRPGVATAQEPPAPAVAAPAATADLEARPGDISSGNGLVRAWRGLGQLWNRTGGALIRATGLGQPAVATVPPPDSALPRPPQPTSIYVLEVGLRQAAFDPPDLDALAQAAQNAQIYDSPRVLIEMAGVSTSPVVSDLRRQAAQALETLAAAGVARSRIQVDFAKGPRLPGGKILRVSVYYRNP